MILKLTNVVSKCQWMAQRTPVIHSIQKSWIHKKTTIPVQWLKPKLGWTKLNFDGSCLGRTGSSSVGGVFRNHKAEFLLGYAEPIETTTSTMAELVALQRGLEFVLENGWSNVWLEGDDMSLVELILQKKRIKCERGQRLVNHINLIIPELENCIVTHIYREGNRAADKFAQIGHRSEKPRIWRNVPPDEVLPIVHDDADGKILLRRIKRRESHRLH